LEIQNTGWYPQMSLCKPVATAAPSEHSNTPPVSDPVEATALAELDQCLLHPAYTGMSGPNQRERQIASSLGLGVKFGSYDALRQAICGHFDQVVITKSGGYQNHVTSEHVDYELTKIPWLQKLHRMMMFLHMQEPCRERRILTFITNGCPLWCGCFAAGKSLRVSWAEFSQMTVIRLQRVRIGPKKQTPRTAQRVPKRRKLITSYFTFGSVHA